MELRIKYGINFELKRVKNTLARLEWYNSQGYEPGLPEGISKESSEKEIQNQIIKEFDEKEYKDIAGRIISDFSAVKEHLSKKLKEIFDQKNNVPPHLKRCGLQGHLFLGCSEIKSSKLRPHSKEWGFNFGHKDIPAAFFVYLTNYGVGGSYNLPNIIILNINNKKGFKTIIHEIIHLLIETWIQEYKVQHWEKERIVDLVLNSKEFSFLKYNNWQGSYDNAEEYIDDLFNKYFFENPKNFFSKIKSARHLVSH